MKKDICGAIPKKHPEMKCCIAYLPAGMAKDIGMGFKISDASQPHWHMDLTVLKDGTILSYKWKGRGERFSCMMHGKGSMNPCSKEDYERMIKEIGEKTKNKMEI